MNDIGRSWRYLLVVAGLALLAFLVIGFNSRMAELRRLTTQAELESVRVTEVYETQLTLEAQIAYATSDAIVEKWAYEEARWVRDGDKLIVPISPAEGTPVPPLVQVSAPQAVDNWQVWMALFFDKMPSP
jgi:hypothetical protein